MINDINKILELLEKQHGDGGFISETRYRNYKQELGNSYINALKIIDFEKLDEMEMKAVLSYIWQIPYLLHGWKSMCLEHGADKDKYDSTLEEIERIVAKYSRLFYALK